MDGFLSFALPAVAAARRHELANIAGDGFGLDELDPQIIAAVQQARTHSQPLQQDTKDSVPIVDSLRYGLANNVPISIGTASQIILAKPTTNRTYLFIVNTHLTQTAYIAFGRNASAGSGIPLYPNGGWYEKESFVPQDDIYAIGSGAATTLILTYSNKN